MVADLVLVKRLYLTPMKQAIKHAILGWAVITATSALVTAHLRAAEPIPPASLASPAPATLALPAAAKALPFPQEGSDLKPEPAARFGALANGLRYVVLPNHEPKGRVSMRLLVLAGSREEKDDQRGLAHFLEHMAFNGSTHYAPGTLVEFFQRMGMRFGGDTNANTSFDRTLYVLELPHADDATLAFDSGDGLASPV